MQNQEFPLFDPDITVVSVEDHNLKKIIIAQCDSAFPQPLSVRENYREIVAKICQYADFTAACTGTEYIGYAAMYANDPVSKTAYISMIGVLDACQRHHVGSRMMEECIRIALQRSMTQIRLEVLNTNHKAIAFYRHFGFVFEKPCTDHSSYMVKALCP